MLPGSILSLLSEQYSLLSRSQLRDRCTAAERRRIARQHELEPLGRRVLRHRAGASDLGQQLLAPVLDAGPGAVLWGHAAAHWWGFGRHRLTPVDIANHPHRAQPTPLGRLHRTKVVDDERDLTIHRNIPIVRPERLILWMCRIETDRYGHEVAELRAARTLDHAWRLRLIDGVRLHQLAERASRQGNTGVVVLRALLETRPSDYRPTDSGLERRWEEVVGPAATGFRRQIVVGDEYPIGRFDQVHRERPLVVEIHSEQHHTMPSDVARDEVRYVCLVEAGFSVVVYWEFDIWHDPAVVRRSLRRILEQPDAPPTVYRPTTAPFERLHLPTSRDPMEGIDRDRSDLSIGT